MSVLELAKKKRATISFQKEIRTLVCGINDRRLLKRILKLIYNHPSYAHQTDSAMDSEYAKKCIEEGLRDIEEGRVISDEEMRKSLAKWL